MGDHPDVFAYGMVALVIQYCSSALRIGGIVVKVVLQSQIL